MSYVALAVISVIWSAYPLGTVVTLLGMLMCTAVGIFVARHLLWDDAMAAIQRAALSVLALSLLFELFVSLVIRHPVLPFFTDYGDAKPPLLAYWSRDVLFEDDRIQGLPGNANLLAFVAAVALIVSLARLATAKARVEALSCVIVAILTLWLTRSSTVLVALVGTGAVVAAIGMGIALRPGWTKRAVVTAVLLVVLGAVGTAAPHWRAILSGFGKSADLTGRTEIWLKVVERIEERPLLGWGFSSPWASWEPQFSEFVVRNGVRQLQAHNAWLDVTMQLGLVGALVFLVLVVQTAQGTLWLLPQRLTRRTFGAFMAGAAPFSVLLLLILQSLTESRILIESGWVLLVILAVKPRVSGSLPRCGCTDGTMTHRPSVRRLRNRPAGRAS
ncbi:O-antigen ligase family protein [Plantibacter sp. VKM Ac-2885]|uniref:O-antigen ligase family protein n=1 Tax=Plantibacter sp. VKM Ac-2885 TaxID=2783828 RepID=UPI00188C68A8|nr:O-antigen ligase family protein [Plantibacter sp. VKM Ac-2885]